MIWAELRLISNYLLVNNLSLSILRLSILLSIHNLRRSHLIRILKRGIDNRVLVLVLLINNLRSSGTCILKGRINYRVLLLIIGCWILLHHLGSSCLICLGLAHSIVIDILLLWLHITLVIRHSSIVRHRHILIVIHRL